MTNTTDYGIIDSVVSNMDLILLQNDDLDVIFEKVNNMQIVFHPYYAPEGIFCNYDDFIKNEKNKVIFLDRNIVTTIYDYFSNGKLSSADKMTEILFFLMFCKINGFQYNVGIAMNEYAEHTDNNIVVSQLNKILNYLSNIPFMVLKTKLLSKDFQFDLADMPNDFNRNFNYKFKSDEYLLSYCSVLKIAQIFLTEMSPKDKLIKYLEWHYDNLEISKYEITYAVLLFTSYPKIKAPKNINGGKYEDVIKGCKNQAWDIAYLSIIKNLQYKFKDFEYFFATYDINLKLIFMGCNSFKNSWQDILYDRLSNKEFNEIFDIIEEKMKNRVKPKCTQETLNKLSNKLEVELKNVFTKEE